MPRREDPPTPPTGQRAGQSTATPRSAEGRSETAAASLGRREFLRARLDQDGRAEIFHSEGSGLIGGLSWADGLIELPDQGLEVAPGDPVRYLPYTSLGLGC